MVLNIQCDKHDQPWREQHERWREILYRSHLIQVKHARQSFLHYKFKNLDKQWWKWTGHKTQNAVYYCWSNQVVILRLTSDKTAKKKRTSLLLDHLLDLLLQHLAVNTRTWPCHLSGQRDHREAIAVANLDHEPIWVMEEELFHLDPAFLYRRPYKIHLHLLQLLLHCLHALALYITFWFSSD